MSVTKDGSDDHNCGFTNKDPLHQAICRVVAGGITGRRGRRQRQPQRHAQHPGQLQRGHHRLRPGRHRWAPGWTRRQPLLLVGRLRQRRHVRELQQLRRRRRHHRPGQMHHVDDPGPSLRVHVGHVDGGPDRRRRRGALQVEPPERDPGRGPRGTPLPRQPELEGLDRPGSDPRAAARRVPHRPARDVRPDPGRSRPPDRRGRLDARRAVHGPAQRDVLRAGRSSSITSLPTGWTGALKRPASWAGPRPQTRSMSRSRAARPRARTRSASAAPTRVARSRARSRSPSSRTTRPRSPPTTTSSRPPASTLGRTAARIRVDVAGRDRPDQPRSPATRSSGARTAAPGASTRTVRRRPSTATYSRRLRYDLQVPCPSRRHRRPLEPVGGGRDEPLSTPTTTAARRDRAGAGAWRRLHELIGLRDDPESDRRRRPRRSR